MYVCKFCEIYVLFENFLITLCIAVPTCLCFGFCYSPVSTSVLSFGLLPDCVGLFFALASFSKSYFRVCPAFFIYYFFKFCITILIMDFPDKAHRLCAYCKWKKMADFKDIYVIRVIRRHISKIHTCRCTSYCIREHTFPYGEGIYKSCIMGIIQTDVTTEMFTKPSMVTVTNSPINAVSHGNKHYVLMFLFLF